LLLLLLVVLVQVVITATLSTSADPAGQQQQLAVSTAEVLVLLIGCDYFVGDEDLKPPTLKGATALAAAPDAPNYM
jgi:hypothetical protein